MTPEKFLLAFFTCTLLHVRMGMHGDMYVYTLMYTHAHIYRVGAIILKKACSRKTHVTRLTWRCFFFFTGVKGMGQRGGEQGRTGLFDRSDRKEKTQRKREGIPSR